MTAPPTLAGRLTPFFETGTEGVVWAVTVDGLLGYDTLLPLENGDELLIYGADGAVAWQGIVNLEYQRRHRPYPTNPQYGQQEIFGYWVHGFQADLEPDAWARPFFQEAPAVVRPKDRPFPDWRERQAFLALLATDPQKALEEALQTRHREGVKSSLDWALKYAYKELGWENTPALDTNEDLANAWQRHLALRRAARALWTPEIKDAWGELAQRWPTAVAMTPQDIEAWAQHKLPHD
jgi:hypothetical protein